MIKQYTDGATAAYDRILTRYPLEERAEDAKKRLQAMKQPIPHATPKPPLLRTRPRSPAAARTGHFGKMMENFKKGPDVTDATKVGEPTLVDPKQASAPDMVRAANSSILGSLGGTNKVGVERVENGAASGRERSCSALATARGSCRGQILLRRRCAGGIQLLPAEPAPPRRRRQQRRSGNEERPAAGGVDSAAGCDCSAADRADQRCRACLLPSSGQRCSAGACGRQRVSSSPRPQPTADTESSSKKKKKTALAVLALCFTGRDSSSWWNRASVRGPYLVLSSPAESTDLRFRAAYESESVSDASLLPTADG